MIEGYVQQTGGETDNNERRSSLRLDDALADLRSLSIDSVNITRAISTVARRGMAVSQVPNLPTCQLVIRRHSSGDMSVPKSLPKYFMVALTVEQDIMNQLNH